MPRWSACRPATVPDLIAPASRGRFCGWFGCFAAFFALAAVPATALGDAVFVGLHDRTIAQYTTEGAVVNPALITELPSFPSAIAVHGERLFVGLAATHTIAEYTITGELVNPAFITGLPNQGPSGTLQIHISGDDLYVANWGVGSIGKYSLLGETINASLITGLDKPYGMATSGEQLFVSNYGAGTIGQYTTSGETVNLNLITGLSNPTGIDVSGEKLYVANPGHESIGEYTTSGETINASLITGLGQSHQPLGATLVGDSLVVVNYGAYPYGGINTGSIGLYTAAGDAINPALFVNLPLPQSFTVAPHVEIPAHLAAASEKAFFEGTRTDPGGTGSSETIEFKSLTIRDGSSYTIGVNETLVLDDGAGVLQVQQGAVLTGNGVIVGSVLNAGLVRIPITAVGGISSISGGTVQIALPDPPSPTLPIEIISPPDEPIVVNGDTLLGFGPAEYGGGGSGGGGGGGGGLNGQSVTWNATTIEVAGTLALDASLDITGSYTQTETGALRLFVAGDIHEPGNERYSVLSVGEEVSLAGSLQIVLQPELLDYLPSFGDTFDVIRSAAGITLDPELSLISLVTTAGAGYLDGLGVAQSPFISGFANDPDTLNVLDPGLWQIILAENNTVLRLRFVSVPEPSSLLLAAMGAVAMVVHTLRRRK